MNTSPDREVALALFAHGLLQVGLGPWIQSALLLLLGVVLGHLVRRSGPLLSSLVYKLTLIGVVVTLFLSVSVARVFPALWHVSLPAVTLTTSSVLPSASFPQETASLEIGGGDSHQTRSAPSRLQDTDSDVALLNGQRPVMLPLAVAERLPSARPTSVPAITPVSVTQGDRTLSRFYIVLGALWCIGTLLQGLWLLMGVVSLLRIRQQSTPVAEPAVDALCSELCTQLHISRPLLFSHPSLPGPFLCGLWRPAIFLPTASLEMDREALRAILAHELVHLARRDQVWSLWTRIVCTIGWFQPLLWVLRHHLEESGEAICDSAVLEMHCSPRVYASCLLRLAERFRHQHLAPGIGVTMLPFRSSLGRRIQAILDPSLRHDAPPVSVRVRAVTFAGLAGTIALSLTLVSTQATSSGRVRANSPLRLARQSPQDTAHLDQTKTAMQSDLTHRSLSAIVLNAQTETGSARDQESEKELREQLSAKEAQVQQLKRQVGATLRQLQQLQAVIRAQRAEEMALKASHRAQQLEALKGRRMALQDQLAELRPKYMALNPRVLPQQSRIEALEKQSLQARAEVEQAQAQVQVAQAEFAQVQAQRQLAVANIQSAQSNLNSERIQYNRANALAKQGFTASSEVESARAQVAQAEAQFAQVQVQAEQARARLQQAQAVLNQRRANLALMQQRFAEKEQKRRQEASHASQKKQSP